MSNCLGKGQRCAQKHLVAINEGKRELILSRNHSEKFHKKVMQLRKCSSKYTW